MPGAGLQGRRDVPEPEVMADDDNNSRYRSNDPSSRGPAQSEPANDPLVELARLIGRSDPFSEIARDSRPSAPRDTGAAYRSEPPPHYGSDTTTRAGNDPSPRYGVEPPPPRYNADTTPRYSTDRAPGYGDEQPAHGEWPGMPMPPQQPYPPADPFALPSLLHTPMVPAPGEQHYDTASFPDPRGRPGLDRKPDLPGFETPAYPPESEPPPFPHALYPDEPESGHMPAPHDDDFYDDAPRSGRRKGLMTVVAVLGLAVIGTAGAFGYRSFYSVARTSSPPPVIRASGEPSKVAPPPAVADQSSNKINYDRFGDRGKDEQVVVREEKPVDSKDLARFSVPRTVVPGAPTAGSASAQPPDGGNAAMNTAPSALGEPKRVRTVQIRPDQPVMPSVPQSAVASAPIPLAPPRQANAAEPPAEMAPPPQSSRAAVSSRSSTRVAARAALPPESTANAPLSLSPNGNNALPPPAGRESARA